MANSEMVVSDVYRLAAGRGLVVAVIEEAHCLGHSQTMREIVGFLDADLENLEMSITAIRRLVPPHFAN